MPTQAFYHLSDGDLGALIAYTRNAPLVDRQTPEPHVRLTFVGNIMDGMGAFGSLLRASRIDQATRPPQPAEPGFTPDTASTLWMSTVAAIAMGLNLREANPLIRVRPFPPISRQGAS